GMKSWKAPRVTALMVSLSRSIRRWRWPSNSEVSNAYAVSKKIAAPAVFHCHRRHHRGGTAVSVMLRRGGTTAIMEDVCRVACARARVRRPLPDSCRGVLQGSRLPLVDKFGKALIVEDDRDVQRAARVALAEHFESIVLAENAARLDQWLDTSTDLVLLDMNFALGQHSG